MWISVIRHPAVGGLHTVELFIAAKMDCSINIRLTLSGNVNHKGLSLHVHVIQ